MDLFGLLQHLYAQTSDASRYSASRAATFWLRPAIDTRCLAAKLWQKEFGPPAHKQTYFTMASSRHVSTTLPRNFTFHYQDGQLPKTPEPQTSPTDRIPQEPPRMPHHGFRVRRRRPAATFREPSPEPYSIPVPSIETSEAPFSDDFEYHLPEPVEGLLKPQSSVTRFFSPPKTPEAQLISHSDLYRCITPSWARDDSFEGEALSRPSSSGSTFSDSSLDSSPSFSGSCTSPESDSSDPFLIGYEYAQSFPSSGVKPSRAQGTQPLNEVYFTREMDDHIWKTYLRVLQDPTATPYKTLPGTVPPSGIQSRVARVAKKTWKGPVNTPKARVASRHSLEAVLHASTPDTIKASKSGSSTPRPIAGRKNVMVWPSEGSTRRRFRNLCRAKPSLSAHYQRLLCRSPSPFQSSSTSESSSASDGPEQKSPAAPSDAMASFSTRDMHMSLATSLASSMQEGNPLSQLAAEPESSSTPNTEWFGQPIARANAHQKSQSLHIGLGLGAPSKTNGAVLGSPFNPRRSRRGVKDRMLHALRNDSSQTDGHGYRLRTPAALPRSFKRRAQVHADEHQLSQSDQSRQVLLNELFGAPAETSHRRVRSRGFSLGDMGEGARQLSSIFTPPITIDASNNMFSSIPMLSDVQGTESLAAQASQNSMAFSTDMSNQLPDPFVTRSPNFHFNTFPRNFTPHTFEPAASFEERFSQGSSVQRFC